VKVYEIDVAGPIGPVVRSCLPAFTTRSVARMTVLTGTVNDPQVLLSAIDLLDQRGLVTLDIRVIGTAPS
jgi:hypothetical protein